MNPLPLQNVFTLFERGPVVLLTTNDGVKDNVMAVSWTMVAGYSGPLAVTTGAWNHSYAALTATKECVLAIPDVDMLDALVAIGTCSGADTDKFAKYGLSRVRGSVVGAPLLGQCLANVECRVIDVIDKFNIVMLEPLAVHVVDDWEDARMIHAVGDGTFIVDGERIDRKAMMRSKLPPFI